MRRAFGWRGGVLADRYHMRVLKTPREVRNAIRYVLLNAARHRRRALRGLDPASSGRWFSGWKRDTARVERRPEPQSVAVARTWLLAQGWRRLGLLDPLDFLEERGPLPSRTNALGLLTPSRPSGEGRR